MSNKTKAYKAKKFLQKQRAEQVLEDLLRFSRKCFKHFDGRRFERNNETFVFEELTSAKELTVEGRTMKHCVASYAHICSKGQSAIFSVRKYAGGTHLETMATIEVNLPAKRIVQAKAKMNKRVSEEVSYYMKIWANGLDLSISP